MRWFLGLVLVIALVCGALYGVGLFLLPNSLAVTRTISINRPRASVFAMSNDLRIAKEWSPLYAQDPDADYAFSGDGPGEGQSMRWVSNNREIGSGRMSIVNSNENQSIDSILDFSNRATLNSHMDFRPGAGSTAVAWSISAECGPGAVNVPCRYMNLVIRPMVERRMDAGLRRLKTLAEQLPNADFEGFDIQVLPVEPQDVLFVDVTIAKSSPTFEDRIAAEADGIGALNNYLASQSGQVRTSSDLVRVFPPPQNTDRYTFSVGYPLAGAPPVRLIGVRVGRTPGGAAVRALFVGRQSQIPAMYQVVRAYMQAHRISQREGEDAWEVVKRVEPSPDASQAEPVEHVEIYYPVDSNRSLQ
ncbi:MAG: SRPBCC family protein [Proteobacteria bacterium]|nr:SRPBCC family protein [Pseudomonadota bacterium]